MGFAGDHSLFRQLLESAPDAMVTVDRTGIILFVNTQAEHVFGYSREELVGQSIELLVPARFRGTHLLNRQSYSASPHARGMGAGLDLCGLRKNGEEFPAEISLSPIQAGDETLISSSIRDVTERKRAQESLQETHAALLEARHARDRAETLARANDEIQLQRLRVFKATMRTVQDIVNNLLNGLQLIRLETEGQLSPDTLALLDGMIQDTAGKLHALGSLETVKEKDMEIGTGIDYPGSASSE